MNNVILIEEYDLVADTWQLTLPGGKVIDPTPKRILQQAQTELREETGFRAGKLEKLLSAIKELLRDGVCSPSMYNAAKVMCLYLDFYNHPGYIAHKVYLLVAYDLEWDPLEMEDGKEIRVHTFTLGEALAATGQDYRCDPEAALALWLYIEVALR